MAILLLLATVNVVAVIAMSCWDPGEAHVGGVDDGSPGSFKAFRDDGGLMPRGGDDDVLGPPDEVHEDVEGPWAPEDKV